MSSLLSEDTPLWPDLYEDETEEGPPDPTRTTQPLSPQKKKEPLSEQAVSFSRTSCHYCIDGYIRLPRGGYKFCTACNGTGKMGGTLKDPVPETVYRRGKPSALVEADEADPSASSSEEHT